MERVIGGVLALVCFIAVVAASALRGLGVWDTVWRGLLAASLGFLAGWLLFGRIGIELAKEAVQGTEAPPPAPVKPPEGTPPAAPKT